MREVLSCPQPAHKSIFILFCMSTNNQYPDGGYRILLCMVITGRGLAQHAPEECILQALKKIQLTYLPGALCYPVLWHSLILQNQTGDIGEADRL